MTSKPRKRGLILGTSHTYGSCEDRVHEPQDRWFGNLYREHDLTVIALPGISNEGLYTYLTQFMTHAWDGKRFDFVIVEGRLPNTTSIGRPLHDEHSDFYTTKSLDDYMEISTGTQLGNIDSLYLTYSIGSSNFDSDTIKNKERYLGTRMQVLHMQAVALSVCVLAETIADKVLFFPAVGFKAVDENNQKVLTDAFDLLYKKFGSKTIPHSFFINGYMAELFHKFPPNPKRKEKFTAKCGHLTKLGNVFLQEPLYDLLSKELDF